MVSRDLTGDTAEKKGDVSLTAFDPRRAHGAGVGVEREGGGGSWPSRFARATRVLGARAVVELVVGILAAIALGLVDLAIGLFLQLFLQRLGLVTKPLRFAGHFEVGPLSAEGLAISLLGIAVARATFLYLTLRGGVVVRETVNERLRQITVFEILLQEERRYVPAALAHARIGETFPKAAYFCLAASTAVATGVQCLLLAIAMTVIAWREALAALVSLALVGSTILAISRQMRAVAARVPGEQRILTSGMERIVRNLLLVRVLRTEAREHAGLVRSIRGYSTNATGAGLLGAIANAATQFFGLLTVLGIVLVSQSVLHTPALAFLSFLYLLLRFTQNLGLSVQMTSQATQFLPQAAEAFRYVTDFSDDDLRRVSRAASDDRAHAAVATQAETIERADPIGPSIELRALRFRYPGAARDALTGITARIESGEQVVVVGPSGAGKSTLLAVVLGLLEPTEGAVAVADREPSDYLKQAGIRVGYVGAESFLVAGTIDDNLRYGLARPVDNDEICTALQRARLVETVSGLADGLEHTIREDGAGLSAGQKQRLCLARALLNRPHLLVLDEITANLDTDTEAEIVESLKELRGRCTMVVVSHRPALLKYADRVLKLNPSN